MTAVGTVLMLGLVLLLAAVVVILGLGLVLARSAGKGWDNRPTGWGEPTRLEDWPREAPSSEPGWSVAYGKELRGEELTEGDWQSIFAPGPDLWDPRQGEVDR